MTVTLGKLKKRASLLGEGGLVLISQVILAATGLIVLKLSTNAFEPEVVAQIALAMTAANLISQFFSGPMIFGTVRYTSREDSHGRLVPYLNMALRHILALILFLAVSLVCGITALLLALGKADDYWFIPVGLLIGCILSLNNFATSNLNALRERGRVTFLAFFESLLRIGAIAVIFLVQREVAYYMTLLCGVLLAQSLLGNWFLFARPSKGDDPDPSAYRARMWLFSKPLMLAAVPFWIYSSFDRWLVNVFGDEQLLAGYAVMYQIGFAPVMLAFGVVRRFAYPLKVDALESGDDALLQRSTTTFFLFFTAPVVVIAMITHFYAVPIVRMMTSPSFEIYSDQLAAFVIGGYFYACGQWFSLEFEVAENTKTILIHRLFSAFALVGCFLVYVSLFGGDDFYYPFIATHVLSALFAALLAFLSSRMKR